MPNVWVQIEELAVRRRRRETCTYISKCRWVSMFGHHKYVPMRYQHINTHTIKEGKSKKKGKKSPNIRQAVLRFVMSWSPCTHISKFIVACRTHLIFSTLFLCYIRKNGEREGKEQFNHCVKVCKIFVSFLGWTPIMKCSQRGTTAFKFFTQDQYIERCRYWNNNLASFRPFIQWTQVQISMYDFVIFQTSHTYSRHYMNSKLDVSFWHRNLSKYIQISSFRYFYFTCAYITLDKYYTQRICLEIL